MNSSMDIKHSSFLLILCCFLMSSLCLETDTITENRSLTGNSTLVSAGGIFELGFFQPGKSSKYYIGLWYKQVSEQTILWVANRENPVSDKYSSELKVLNGNLVLTTNGTKTPIWSTNLNHTSLSSSVQAVLFDPGNFVLRATGPNPSDPLWQSADHPTQTWLPGYKIGFDKVTKTKRVLTSWKNTEDPSPGPFSFELNLNGTTKFVILWNGTKQYWTSGSWSPHDQSFSLVPEIRNKPKNSYNFSFVNNENETYFTYNVRRYAVPSRLIMDVSGQLKSLTWVENTKKWTFFLALPRQQCEVYGCCGVFGSCSQNSLPSCNCLYGFGPKSKSDWDLSDYTGGCLRRTPLQCENSTFSKEKDRFWVSTNMGLPQRSRFTKVGSFEACKSECLQNCSCNAYTYENGGCSIWNGDLLNVKKLSDGDPNGKTLYIRLAASEFPSTNRKKMIISMVLGSVAGTVVLLGLVFTVRWGRKRQSVAMEGTLVKFSYRELQTATKNFSESLGGGGFGAVFKGTLRDSSLIAVKKLESVSQGEKQFRTEVSTIGTIQHVNLVRLRGFCSEGSKRLLVYDYMPNGSLNTKLFNGQNTNFLDWKTRYQIAVGTAKGLTYLHEKCRDCIIHCDIKPENVLLDVDFCPKVADFGLAKLIGRDFSRALTTMRGTRGYLAPEWISGQAISAKADVYSYGMMLFELISGRRNVEQLDDERFEFFPTWAVSKLADGEDIISIVDHSLEGNADREEVMRICKLACWCIQDDETERPSMGQVVQILEGVVDVSIPPIPRTLKMFSDDHDHIIFFTESSSGQSPNTSNYASATTSLTQSTSIYVTAVEYSNEGTHVM